MNFTSPEGSGDIKLLSPIEALTPTETGEVREDSSGPAPSSALQEPFEDSSAALAEDSGGPFEADASPEIPADAYATWVELVERIRSGQADSLEELYLLFSKGIRFYLCRQLGPQELDDKVHDTFVVVVQAIQRGELREPERLMGFVRTIVRRQVAAHIDKVVHNRREQVELDPGIRLADPRENPEQSAIFRQNTQLIHRVLGEMNTRDREILTRFYLQEQSQDQICSEMALSETQFRLLKSRAKARFGELGKRKISQKTLSVFLRTSAGLFH